MTHTGVSSPGSIYAEYFKELVAEQEARKGSLEQRGLSVITSSGGLATLLFGLVAVFTQAKDFELPKQANGPLAVALVAFGGAALLGLLTNLPLRYESVAVVDPAAELKALWTKSQDDAVVLVAVTRAKVYKKAKRLNGWKAGLLLVAMTCQVVAVVALAIAVSEVLRHG